MSPWKETQSLVKPYWRRLSKCYRILHLSCIQLIPTYVTKVLLYEFVCGLVNHVVVVVLQHLDTVQSAQLFNQQAQLLRLAQLLCSLRSFNPTNKYNFLNAATLHQLDPRPNHPHLP